MALTELPCKGAYHGENVSTPHNPHPPTYLHTNAIIHAYIQQVNDHNSKLGGTYETVHPLLSTEMFGSLKYEIPKNHECYI